MWRLTREVRLAVDPDGPVPEPGQPVANGFGGFPSLRRLSAFVALDVTVEGPLDAASQYLLNIKDIDAAVRQWVWPVLRRHVATGSDLGLLALAEAIPLLRKALPGGERGVRLAGVALRPSPYLVVERHTREEPMVRLSSRFEFSAAHRLHNPALSDADNQALFGKCNNPLGHGHNYELAVTVRGEAGQLPTLAELEAAVNETVIRPFDHKHLNEEVQEFQPVSRGGRGVIPSVENIAAVIFARLKPVLGRQLASVTVWETPKTWAEYTEEGTARA